MPALFTLGKINRRDLCPSNHLTDDTSLWTSTSCNPPPPLPLPHLPIGFPSRFRSTVAPRRSSPLASRDAARRPNRLCARLRAVSDPHRSSATPSTVAVSSSPKPFHCKGTSLFISLRPCSLFFAVLCPRMSSLAHVEANQEKGLNRTVDMQDGAGRVDEIL